MKVETMTTSLGNPAANQFVITDGSRRIFQSYSTVIAVIENGKVTLDSEYWDYSATTGKYRNKFLGEGIAETRAKIKSGEYALADLQTM